MKYLLVLLIWFPVALISLGTSLFSYSYYTKVLLSKNKLKLIAEKPKFYQMYVSHPQTLGMSTASVQTKDAVPELVYQYLQKYNSPMAGSAFHFVKIFREYNIDPVFPLAVAQCESNLGAKMPPDCHNPFGLGIHSKGTLCFPTWEEGYEKMAKTLKKRYVDKGLITIDQIMKKYCPISAKEKDGSWAKCVNQFVQEIETFNIRRK